MIKARLATVKIHNTVKEIPRSRKELDQTNYSVWPDIIGKISFRFQQIENFGRVFFSFKKSPEIPVPLACMVLFTSFCYAIQLA